MPHRLRIEEPPEPPPPPRPDDQSILTLATIQSIFNAAWKLLPLLWFAFQFYANQTAIAEKVEGNKKIIEKLQAEIEKMNRQVGINTGTIEAVKQIQDNDRQFFMQTQSSGRH